MSFQKKSPEIKRPKHLFFKEKKIISVQNLPNLNSDNNNEFNINLNVLEKEEENLCTIKEDENKEKIIKSIKKQNTINYSLHNRKNNLSPIKTKNKIIHNIYSISQKGTKEINQDNYLISEDIFNIKNFNIYSIFDGHGQNGHYISNLVKEEFIDYFSNHSELYYIPRLENVKNNSNFKTTSLNKYINTENLYNRLIYMNYKVIKEIYKKIDEKIKNTDYDKEFSGTTSCSVFIIGNHLLCSNVGDSRAILIKKSNEVFPLSNDHKPNNYYEKERILKCGGDIKRIKDSKIEEYVDNLNNNNNNIDKKIIEINIPFRVYVKGKDYPGLAMSRSLGDFVAKKIGVIHEPEILDITINEDDKFIILASDGLWEVVSNEEARNIVNKYYIENNVKIAVEKLAILASEKFKVLGEYIDDITIIVIFLNKKKTI